MVTDSMDILTDIRGVGRSKAETLLQDFGSLDNIKQASHNELVAVEGIGPAVAERLEDMSGTSTGRGNQTNSRSAKNTSQSQSIPSDPDPGVQELATSLKNASSLEELYELARTAKNKLHNDSKVAARNPELVTTLAKIYQREEDRYVKEEYDRVYVLRYTAWALSESVKHRPEPVLEIIETPLRLLRDTTVSKNIRNAASSIMETLVSEHPERLVPILEEHHTAVSEAMEFWSSDQPSQTAPKAAAKLISTYTEQRDTGLFHQHVEALFKIINQDSAYISLQRIAEEHPTSVFDNVSLFVDEIWRDVESDLKVDRAADVLEIASQSISTASGQWITDLSQREAESRIMRRKLVPIYSNIAKNTEQSIVNSQVKLKSLVTDDDWQIREKAIELVRHADIPSSERKQLLSSLEADPIPEVSERASEALSQ